MQFILKRCNNIRQWVMLLNSMINRSVSLAPPSISSLSLAGALIVRTASVNYRPGPGEKNGGEQSSVNYYTDRKDGR